MMRASYRLEGFLVASCKCYMNNLVFAIVVKCLLFIVY